jgi:hypothetical protein
VQKFASYLADNTWAVYGLLGAWVAFKAMGPLKWMAQGLSKVFGGMGKTKDAIDEMSDAMDEGKAPFESFIETINKVEPKKMMAFGFAMLLIGGGVALAAIGLAKFVAAFAGMTPGQILAVAVALAVFGATMVGLAFAMGAATASVPAMLGMALAFVLLGAAVCHDRIGRH